MQYSAGTPENAQASCTLKWLRDTVGIAGAGVGIRMGMAGIGAEMAGDGAAEDG